MTQAAVALLSLRARPARLLLLGLLLALAGCATLPPLPARSASHALPAGDGTALAALARPPAGAPADASGVRVLDNPLEAFAARVMLARRAEKTLDVQYYIWNRDITGLLLLDELCKAADRGVRVRLLLDDNGIAGLDPLLAALDRHPGIEVRLFNPFPGRRFKALGYLTDFRRLNHRMHNKAFTADASATLVGGRNIGDDYYGATAESLVADLDLLALGPAATHVEDAFDAFWNDPAAWPAAALLPAPAADAEQRLQATFAAARHDKVAARYLAAVAATADADALRPWTTRLTWAPVAVVWDAPGKVRDEVPPGDLLLPRVLDAIADSRSAVDLVSPYLVPGREGTRVLADAARRGVQVRTLTNSLASSDHAIVHAGYARYREDLVRAGIEVHELRPLLGPAERKALHRRRGALSARSASMLHTKTFVIDRRLVFVGSFNLDPRSTYLNTEMGLVIDSPALAAAIAANLDRRLPQDSWEVRLTPDEEAIEWVQRDRDGDETVLDREPESSALRRLGLRLLMLLPVDGLL